MNWIFFAVFALLSLGGAVMTVSMRNPVYSAVSLIGSFMGMAMLYLMLFAHFLAFIQVMVYAGAIIVLFLFVILLLDQQDEGYGFERGLVSKVSGLVAAAGVALILAYVFLPVGEQKACKRNSDCSAGMICGQMDPQEGVPCKKGQQGCVRQCLLKAQTPKASFGTIEQMGFQLFRFYLYPFEFTSVLLLAAITGAVVLAKRKV